MAGHFMCQVKLQRERMKKGKLPLHSIKRLKEIGFNWGSAGDAAAKALAEGGANGKSAEPAMSTASGNPNAHAVTTPG
eukprot:scaffold312480_cov42-Prasinocladus_malaysianus.AAC.1